MAWTKISDLSGLSRASWGVTADERWRSRKACILGKDILNKGLHGAGLLLAMSRELDPLVYSKHTFHPGQLRITVELVQEEGFVSWNLYTLKWRERHSVGSRTLRPESTCHTNVRTWVWSQEQILKKARHSSKHLQYQCWEIREQRGSLVVTSQPVGPH